MKINYVELKSPITPINQDHSKTFLSDIESAGGFHLVKNEISNFSQSDFCVIFIMTGGTERIFLENFEIFSSKPCYLLASGESNSLAASMEILSYLKSRGYKGEILHGDAKRIAERINSLYRTEKTLRRLNGMRVGTIGGSSDWLIDSEPDEEAYRTFLGIEMVHISMDELLTEIHTGGFTPNEWTEKLLSLGYDKKEMEKAFNVYGAVKRIVEKYNLSAVTVRCFDLLTSVHTTGCLALAILNAEGIYAGCEGDMPSLISMIILGEISQKPVFMCNLNRIDTENNELIFAHCTLPVNMPYKMELTTHYESGIGVAIAGSIPEDDFTIFKISNDLSNCFAAEGKIIENRRDPNLCRTQIKVSLNHYEYFLTNPIANHHLICLGRHQKALEDFYRNI